MTVQEKLNTYSFFDGAILSHGFTSYIRDYEIVVEASAWYNKDGAGRYSYCFTHCVHANYNTNVRDDTWRISWSDTYTDYEGWKEAGEPEGKVWGVSWAGAYPGLTYLENSEVAHDWSQRLGRAMHEVRIETEVYWLNLVFYDVVIRKIGGETPILDRVNIPIEP
ncbi:MAG: hypothetical protein WCD37_07275 [Chloroflexia bacterium]